MLLHATDEVTPGAHLPSPVLETPAAGLELLHVLL